MPIDNADIQSNPLAGTGAQSANPDFRLQYSVEGGEKHATGLYQWMSALNIKGGASTRALMLVTRYNGDLPGRPVGLFSDPLGPVAVRRMVQQLDAVASANLPKSTGGGNPMGPTPRLEYQHGPHSISGAFNRGDQVFVNAIAPVVGDLIALMSEMLTKPERAVAVSVEQAGSGRRGLRLQFRLTNVGTGDVIVADPRLVSPVSPKPRGFVQVSPWPVTVPGQPARPPVWQRIALDAAPRDTEDTEDTGVTIKPQESVVFQSALWTAPASAVFVAQAVWEDYHGPVKIDPTKVQPPIPPEPGTDDRPFVVRGAAFSKYVRVEAGAA